jgi:hypothetical protein
MKTRETILLVVIAVLVLVIAGGALAVSVSEWPDYVVVWKDGKSAKYVIAETWIPSQTPSISPSPSPSRTPSVTPTQERTPVATNTATQTPFPTPTVEATTATPFPTATSVKQCYVKVYDKRINVRNGPSVYNAVISVIDYGETQNIVEVTHDTTGFGYLWGKTVHNGRYGWFVIKNWDTWWVYSLGSETQPCTLVPGWTEDIGLPPELNPVPTATPTPRPPTGGQALLLTHLVPGGNIGELQNMWQLLMTKGIEFGVKSINEPSACNAAEQAGGVCIYRSVIPQDCPPGIPGPGGTWTDPRLAARNWIATIEQYTVAQNIMASYIEPINECYMGNPSTDRRTMAWWDDFMQEAIDEAQRRGFPPLAMPSLNPGVGDYEFLEPFRASLTKLMQSGGLFSMHDYGIDQNLWPCNIYTSCRHRMVRSALVQLGLSGLPITVTEAARGSGNWPVDEADFANWFMEIKDDPGLHSVALWNAGHTGAWPNANLNGHMLRIAELVH